MTNSSRPITQQNPITQNPVINSGLTNPVNVGATTVPTGFQIPATLQNLIRGIIPTIQNPVVRGLLSGLVGGQNGTYTMINGTNIAVQDGQGANVILNLRIRFFSNANTNTAYRTIPIRVIIAGGGMSSPIGQVVNFTNAGNNLWTGRVGFQTNSNTNYSIYIKGPKHLQVKICDSSPRDNVNNNDILGIYKCGNVGQVLLRQGENNYDFTGIYMLPGDINQDGVLNNIDYGLLDSCFNWNIGADPNGQCSQADLNFDGAVNLMDKGLLDYVFTKNFKTSDDNF